MCEWASEGQPLSCGDLNLVLYAPLFTALSPVTMPPFSFSLFPLSLKEIEGLRPAEGNCVSRLPTIMTPRHVTGRERDLLPVVCCLFSLLLFSLLFVHRSDNESVLMWMQSVLGGRWKTGVIEAKSAAVLPVYPGLAADSGKEQGMHSSPPTLPILHPGSLLSLLRLLLINCVELGIRQRLEHATVSLALVSRQIWEQIWLLNAQTSSLCDRCNKEKG